MIYFERVGQVLRVAQEIKSPSVYLDHWALREISESDELACRFSRFLRSHGGTLVLSWLNVVEFCKVADAAQRRKADLLIHGLFPNLFWLNPDFFTVEKNERMSGTQQLLPCLPHSDLDLAYTYVRIALRNSVKPRSLRSQNIFTAIHSIPDIPKQYDELADLIVSQIEWLRTRYENTKAMQAKLRALPKRQVISRGTRLIAREFIGRFLNDRLLRPSRNDAIDLSHAVVSVSYCDYALLDGHWVAPINNFRRRIAKAGVSLPMAKVFSKRANGVEEFLSELSGKT